jgi:hypothetical protein
MPPQGGVAQDHQKQNGGRQLKQEFGRSGQAGVLLVTELGIVVQKANTAKDKGKSEQGQWVIVPLPHGPKDSHRQGGQNEGDPAHGGGALLALVPHRTVRLDGLTHMGTAEGRDDEQSQQGGEYKADGGAQGQFDQSFHVVPSLFQFLRDFGQRADRGTVLLSCRQ